MDPEVLDGIIGRLLEVRTARPGTLVRLAEVEIQQLCTVSRQIFLGQPNLLELEAPIKICGQLRPATFPSTDLPCLFLGLIVAVARSWIPGLLCVSLCLLVLIR